MPILLKTIRIAGFRAHKSIEIDFDPQTVLIGTNNVGKTTILNALQLAMGDGRFSLTPDDFHLENGVPCSELIVDLKFVPTEDAGNLSEDFDQTWTSALGKGIKDDGERQFFAFRTRVSSEEMDKNLIPIRCILNQWLDYDSNNSWQDASFEGDSFRVSFISKAIPLYFQNAQRDILDDIRQRSSFLGKALSKINYDPSEQAALQELIEGVNDKAVKASPILGTLKENLSLLGNTFGTTQGSADITPFAKNIRDLTKSVRLHFHDGVENLSMEYHGMGTRSWSSLLVLKAYVQIIAKEAEALEKPYYPILALEEPEAHLHPNAQKQIIGQIKDFPGQIIVSTHSPHVVAQAAEVNLSVIRMLYKKSGIVQIGSLSPTLDPDFIRKLQRQIIQTRGELLFSKAWILFEGEAEAQAFPHFFNRFFGKTAYDLGIDLISCGGGGNYAPFLNCAKEMNIPWYIFSDGEIKILKSLTSDLKTYTGFNDEVTSHPCVFALKNEMDYESYLLNSGYEEACKMAIENVEGSGFLDNQIQKKNGTLKKPHRTEKKCSTCKQNIFEGDIRDYSGNDKYMRYLSDLLDDSKKKTKYAEPIALEILKLPTPQDIPERIRDLFKKVKADIISGDTP